MLSATLIRAGLPPRVESEPFYAVRQKRDLLDCHMIVKTEALRKRLAAWMSGAASVVQIGIGGGHLALLQKLLCPEAHLVTVDHPDSRVDKRHAKAAKHYTRAAGQWLQNHFAGSVQSLLGWPGATLTRFTQSHPEFRADLLHINGITPFFLNEYGAGVEMLKPEGYIIISNPRADQLRDRIQQLQLNGEISTPIDYADFGPRHGAVAVLRRL